MRASVLALLAACSFGCSQQHVYWGDVHGHTANSDGLGSVTEYLRHARDVADLDFVIVTDHDFGNGRPSWNMPQEVWDATQDAVASFTVAGEFVAIAGYEWTSQPKYWVGFEGAGEGLFPGPPRYYNHKNVYFPGPVPYLFSAKDPASNDPNELAQAVLAHGGLIHNNHPTVDLEGRDQWEYDRAFESVIANTELGPDVVRYEGEVYRVGTERVVRAMLATGRKSGFVGATDTHEGKPAARTAVFARELTSEAVFEALRSRRCYAITNARIVLDFKIDGHPMGEEVESRGAPRLTIRVTGTDRIEEVAIIRDGAVIHVQHPTGSRACFDFVDHTFGGASYYYVRVTQRDQDEHGNPSRAWSSPIWVRRP